MTDNKSRQFLDVYEEVYMQNFGTPKLVLERGRGSKVWDVDGREYIDLLDGIAVNSLGHANQELVQAISKQASNLMHVSNFFTTPAQTDLSKKLVEILRSVDSGVETARVMLTNSGTESVEGALKIAKKYALSGACAAVDASNRALVRQLNARGGKILALQGSFHGRTLGGLSVTAKEKYRTPFAPLIPNIEFVRPNDILALEQAFEDDVIAMIVEPIQGEAGVLPLESSYLQRVRQLTEQNDALMVVDEVQTGVGRTGQWFAYKGICSEVTPDVITLAKGLGGGFPIGAIIAINGASKVLQPGDHGTTFGGNPLAAVAALKVLEVIEHDDLMPNASKCMQMLANVCKTCQFVSQIRGSGALIALQLTEAKAAQVYQTGLEYGVIVNPVNESAIRLAPALNIEPEVFEEGCQRLMQAINDVFSGTEVSNASV